MSITLTLLNYKQTIKTVGWMILFSLFVIYLNLKGLSEDQINLMFFCVLFGLMNLVTILWFVLAIFKTTYRSKKVVSVLTPYISTTIVSSLILLLIISSS